MSNPSELPPGATETSRDRLRLAGELADGCPAELGTEIAVTGSVSRGVADQDSDVELNFWTPMLPSRDTVVRFLKAKGATDIRFEPQKEGDEGCWSSFRYRSTWFEGGWETFGQLERNLDGVLAGKRTRPGEMMIAETVSRAVVIRSDGRLDEWQEQLRHYPDGLQERLIDEACWGWTYPQWVDVPWALLRRDQRMALAKTLYDDLQRVLRIVFALNRSWEPNWKWLAEDTAGFNLMPGRLVERIDAVVMQPATPGAIAGCHRLGLDALEPAAPTETVLAARRALGESLSRNAPAG